MKKMSGILMMSVVTVFGLSGCGSECTEDELKDKLEDLTVKIQGLATSGDMGKMVVLSQKAAQIYQSTQGDSDINAACEAVDDLLDEL